MEKLLDGVYRLSFGTPEKHTYVSFRAFPARPAGKDHPAPFGEDEFSFACGPRGCTLLMPLRGEVYGFGLQLKGFQHTLRKRVLRCNADAPSDNGESHAPVPFFVTTAGYGVLVDSARDVAFYCGESRFRGESRHFAQAPHSAAPEATEAAYRSELYGGAARMRVEVPVAQGVDVYLFAGADMLEAVRKYVMFCGGGAALPERDLGAWYRLYGASTAAEWVCLAQRLKEQGLPFSVLGLEPGWQTHAYSCSFTFDGERLGDCRGALNRLHAMGYRVNLWEHCYTHPSSPMYEALYPYAGDCEVWGGLVPDFALREARDVFVAQQRTLGADSFKLDECDGSDHTGGWSFPDGARFPSGLDGEQMHHLLGLLYQQTICEAFPDACHSVRASGAMAAPYPFVLYSDLYAHEDFIRGVCNAGFSGLLWAPEVRHAQNLTDLIRRMQTALFSPQMLVNAWYLKNPPWEQLNTEKNVRGEPMAEAGQATEMVRALLHRRMALAPYLARMYRQYRDTGKPVFRALVLDFPGDEECRAIDNEYLMGDDYLFAPLTAQSDERRVYLPAGQWVRGGERFETGWRTFRCALDEYLLFRRAESGEPLL